MILKQTSALALIITFALPAYGGEKADETPVLRYSDDIELEKGNYLVVGVLATEGAENSEYTKIISNAPTKANETVTPENILIDLNKFIPPSEKAYRYAGSFTTLPCTEGVKWFILETPVTLSKEQIDTLSTIHPNNNRPIQR